METGKVVRNVAILVVIAAAVTIIGEQDGGGNLGEALLAALWAAFALGGALVLVRAYRERRTWLYGLGDRHRLLLYAGIAMGIFAWAARKRMWATGFGELVWFVIVALAAYFLMEVYRRSRSW